MAKVQQSARAHSPRRSPALQQRRWQWLSTVSAAAAGLGILLSPQSAMANGTNANVTVQFGANPVVQRDATTDAVTITSNQALVDWTMTDPDVFLPAGNGLIFRSDNNNYTVLNRIFSADPTRPVAINGTVLSLIGTNFGGNVWFYNPGGILAGPTSQFIVGSLLLTSNEIQVDLATQSLFGPGNTIRFRGSPDSTSSVIVDAGARILLPSEGSYLALVAPRVEQRSGITAGVPNVAVNGSVAYVAAEQLNMRINNGLFDIDVLVGTTDTQGVVHSGLTTGPARNPTAGNPATSTPPNPDNHGIYMVAVPKNDALTMLVSGVGGYTAAANATQADGRIILSAGYDIVDGEVDATTGGTLGGTTRGHIDIRDFGAFDDVTGFSTGDTILTVDATNTIVALEDMTLTSAGRMQVSASNNGLLRVDGNLTLNSGTGAAGNAVAIGIASGADMLIGGDLTADVSGKGAVLTQPGDPFTFIPGSVGADASGGSLAVSVDNARLEVAGATSLRANAQSGVGALSAGVEAGGTINVSMAGSGAVMELGSLSLSASALGGSGGPGQPVLGNKSTAGQANLTISGGTLTATAVSLEAEAIASGGSNSPAGLEIGSGGAVRAEFTGGTHGMDSLTLSTSSGAITNNARAGAATLTVDNATVNVTGQVSMLTGISGNQVGLSGNMALNVRNAGVLTGDSLNMIGSAQTLDSNVRGSDASIQIDNGSATFDTMQLTLGGTAETAVLANGGNLDMDIINAGSFTATSLADIDSNALGGLTSTGGRLDINIDNGTFASALLFLGNSGIGNPNGLGVGGTTLFDLSGVDGQFNVATMFSNSDGRLDNDSEGGGRPADGLGGSGRGGSATFNFNGGAVSGDTMQISAEGQGGDGGIIAPTPSNPTGSSGNGGVGTGGTATVNLLGSTVNLEDLTVTAKGSGGSGSNYDLANDIAAGSGGVGRGGTATINARAGELTAGTVTVEAGANDFFSPAFGGFGGRGGFGGVDSGGAGGAGTGGTAVFVQNGATSNITTLTVTSFSTGGNGGQSFAGLGGGAGGAATGGNARLEQRAGTLDATSIIVDAGAFGGRGGEAFASFVGSVLVESGTGGVGGAATGGTASVDFLRALDEVTGVPQPYAVRSNAVGGRGGNGLIGASGGTALGGLARIQVNNFTVSLANPVVEANGTGGVSGGSAISNPAATGANGRGGTALIDVQGAAGVLNLNGLTLNSTGTGQAGADGAQAANDVLDGGDGGDGGDGRGGTARVAARLGGTVNLISSGPLTVNVAGQGGIGGAGGRSQGFTAGRSGDAGDGGDGQGGAIQFTANNGTLNLGSVVLNAGGTGGNGGDGPGIFDGEIVQTNGGAGGTGEGGRIAVSAVTAASRVNISEFVATAHGQGGTGSNGVIDSFGLGIAGANGGAGGGGIGGAISLSAGDGRLVIANTSPIQMTAEGRAGAGGNGTNGDFNATPGGTGGAGGNGGNGGSATGGRVELLSGNGLFQAGDVTIGVNGIGREGGNPGGGGSGGPGVFTSFPGIAPGAPGLSGNFGADGTGEGGVSRIFIELGEGAVSAGTIRLGQTNIIANGRTDTPFGSFTGFGGLININNGIDGGVLNFAGLNMQVQGAPITGFESINILSSGTPILVTNDLVADAGADILFGIENSGGVNVGGDIRLTSAQFITMRYSGCVAEICLGDPVVRAGGRIDATAGGHFILQGAFVLGSTLDLVVRAEADVITDQGSQFRAPRFLDISALGNVTVRNADANAILIEAGVVRTPVAGGGVIRDYSDALLTLGESFATGIINSRGRIDLNSGGSIDVLADTQLTAGQSINLISGNDILIGSNASLLSNDAPMDPAADFFDPGNVIVNAGGIPSTLGSGSFVTSIIMQGGSSIMAQGAQLRLSANAIDAGNASLAGQALFADVFNAPPNGTTQSDDDGQLSANCLEGDICIGALAFVDSVNIGQSGVPIRFTGPGDISATAVRITTRRGMTMGTLNVDTSITGANEVTLQSLEGDISLLQGLNIQGNVIRITADQGSLLGGGSLASPGDIGITVGADISAATIETGGQLTQVADIGGALESSYAVPGNIVVANYVQSAAGQFEVQAGGNIDFASITVPGQDVRLFAGPNVRLGSNAGTQNLVMSAGSVFYGALVADQTIDLQALAGGITGNNATAGGDLLMDAQGADINVVNLSAGGSTRLTSNANINFGSSTSTSGSLTISGLDIGGGAVSAGSFVDVTSTSVGLGNITANAGTVSVIGSVGAVQTGDVAATDDVTLNARGNLGLGAVQSGGAVALQSQTSGLSSGNLTGGSINASATGAVVTGVVIANTSGIAPHDVVINAGTTLDYSSITAADAVQLRGTAISGGGVQAGLGIDIGGTALNLGAVSALGGPVLLRASTGNIVAGAVNATGNITISALLGTIQTGALNAGALLDIDAGGAIGFTTASGASGVTIDSNGAITFASVSSSNGGVTINGAGGVTGTSVASQSDAIVTASAGNVSLAQLTSNGLARVTGRAVSLGATQTAGNLTIGASAGAINGTGAWTVGGGANLSSSAATTLTTLAATGNVTANGGTGFGYQTLSGNAVSITAGGAIAGQGITASGALTLDGSSIAVGALQSTGAMGLTADTTLRFTTANAGGAFTATADDLGFTGIRAGGNVALNARLTNGGNVVSTGGAIALALTGDATLANVSAANALTGSVANLAYGALNGTSGGVTLTGGNFAGGQVTGAGVSLDGTTLNLGGVQSTAGITLRSTGVTRFTGASAATGVSVTADDLGFTSILAGGSVALNARVATGGNVTSTSGDIALAFTGAVTLADVLAGNAITGTFADLTYGSLTGTNGGVNLTGGALTGGAVSGAGIALTGTSLDLGALASTASIALQSSGATQFTTASATNGFTAAATDLAFASIIAGNNIGLNAGTATGGNMTATAGSIALALTGNATLADLLAGSGITGTFGNLNYGSLTGTNGGVSLTGGALSGGNVSGASIDLTGTSLALGALATPGNLALRSTGATSFTGAQADGDVSINAAALDFDHVIAAGAIALTGTDITGNVVRSTLQDVTITGSGDAGIGAIEGSDVRVSAAGFTSADIQARGLLSVTAASGTGTQWQAGDALNLNITGALNVARLIAGGAGQIAADSYAGTSLTSGGDLTINVRALNTGSLASTAGTVTFTSQGGIVGAVSGAAGIAGNVGALRFASLTSSGGAIMLAGSTITGGAVTASGGVSLDGTALTLGNVRAGGLAELTSTGAIAANQVTGQSISIDAGSSYASAAMTSTGGPLAIAAGTSITTGALNVAGNANLSAGFSLTTGTVRARDLTASAGTVLTLGDVTAQLTTLRADDIVLSRVSGSALDIVADTSLSATALASTGTIAFAAPSVTLGSVTATGQVTGNGTDIGFDSIVAGGIALTGQNVSGVLLQSVNAIALQVPGQLSVDSLISGGNITGDLGTLRFGSMTSSGGAIALTGTTLDGGAVTAAGGVSLDGTSLTLGNVRGGGLVDLTSSGAITVNQVTGQSISIDAATSYASAAMTTTGGPLAITAGTSLNTGALNAAGNANLIAATSLTTGTIIARDLSAIAGTVLTLGDVTADSVTLRAADIALSRVSGSALDIVAGTSLSATDLASTGAIAFTAPSATLGSVTADGQVTGNGDSIGFDSIVAGGISLAGDSVSGGLLQSVSGIDLQIPGLLTVDSVAAGSGISGNLGTLRFGSMTADGDIDLQTANVEGGTLNAGGLAQLISTGAINLASANGGDVLFNAGSADITITGLAQAAGSATLIGGNLFLGDVVAGTSLDLLADNQLVANTLNGGSIGFAAGSADLGSVTSGGSLTGLAGAIRFTALDASADIDLAADSISGGSLNAGAGINLVSTGDLTIGDARSVGTLALLGGAVQAGNLLSDVDINVESASTITTGDITAALGSVLIANGLGTITTGVITAANDFTLDTGSNLVFAGVNVGDDIRITSAGSMDIGRLEARGTGTDNEGDGSRIVLFSGGAMLVSHAESVDGFTADAARFETGLNTIITGGDIVINTSGDSLLGNSQAGGLIRVTAGGLIDFNIITSGGLTSLNAATTITGVSNSAGGSFDANAGGNLGIGNISANGGLFASSGGALTLGTATSGGDAQLRTTGAGNLAVTSLQAAGNVIANANAAASIGTANATNGNIYVIATGPATLNNANAGVMIGVSGAGVSGSGAWNAGEDILVLSTGTANLGALSAGDDVDVIAPGGIALASGTARGTARDDRALQVSTITTGPQFVIVSTAPDGADVRLTSSGGGISAGALDAGDDVTVNAANAVALSGVARTRGLGTTGGASNIAVIGSDVTMAGSQAFTDLLVTASGQMALGNAQAGGRVQAISSGGNASFASLQAGSSALVQATGGINGGAATTGTGLTLDGASVALTGNAQAGGAANLTARSGAITAANVGGASITANAATSFASGALTSSGDLSVTSGTGLSTGSINAAGAANLNTGGDMTTGTVAASALNGIAGGAINLGNASIINAASLNGNSVALASVNTGTTLDIVSATSLTANGLTSGGNTTVNAASINPGSIASGGSIAANGGSLTASSLSAAGDIALALSGPVAVTTFNANGTIIGSTCALSFDSMTSGGVIDLTAASVTGGIVDAGGTARFASTGAQTFATLLAGGDVTLNASNGAIAVTSNIATPGAVTAIGNAVTLNAAGPLTVQQATANAGNVGITAAQNLVVNNASASGTIALTSTSGSVTAGALAAIDIILRAATGIALTGNVVASDELDMTAGGLIDISALASGASITARSADIDLGSTARLGQNGSTQTVSLVNSGAGAMTLGGSAAAAGYRLTNAEAARITSNGNLRFDAGNPAGVANALVVQDLTLNAAATNGQIGATGAVDFVTGGNVLVNGALALNNAEGNDLRIVAGNDLVVDSGTGSVRLIEGSGRGGTLSLAADRIAVVTPQALTDITGQPVDAIDLRLASNDGITDGRTTLEAFEIFASADSGLFIQNTASIDDLDARTGFVANRFAIETRGGAATGIAINGVIIDSAGLPITGIDTIGLVTIADPTGGLAFDSLSTINGCLIANPVGCLPLEELFNSQLRDFIEEEVEDQKKKGTKPRDMAFMLLGNMLIEVKDFERFGYQPPIDEPVTGAGNDDLWVPVP